MSSPLDGVDLRRRVQQCLDAELATQAGVLAELGPDVDDLLTAVADLLRGGKRLRAAFLYWGHRAAGRPDSDALVRLASAMELFQAAALIHDDVMDDSDTRRGMPAAHRALATRHTAGAGRATSTGSASRARCSPATSASPGPTPSTRPAACPRPTSSAAARCST